MNIDKLYDLRDDIFPREILFYQIPLLYMPFNQISSSSPENQLMKALEKNKMVSVHGMGGCGKTSIINYVLYNLDSSYFPIILSPLTEDIERVCSSPEDFMKFILSQMHSAINKSIKMKRKDIKEIEKMMSSKITILEGIKKGFFSKIAATLSILPKVFSGGFEVGGDIQKYTEIALDKKLYNTDRISCLQKLVETIKAHDKNLIICLDDTDKFLKHGNINWTHLIDSFFIKIIPLLNKIECPIVLSSHKFYDNYQTFNKAIDKYFFDKIKIPIITNKGFMKIINHNLQYLGLGVSWKDIFDNEAGKCIYDYYISKEGDIRETFTFCKNALIETIKKGDSIIKTQTLFKLLQEKNR